MFLVKSFIIIVWTQILHTFLPWLSPAAGWRSGELLRWKLYYFHCN